MQDLVNDHDLLIELRTELRGLRQDINKSNTDTTIRVADLEKNKLDVDVFREKNKDIFDSNSDHERRVRILEASMWKWIGVNSVITVIVTIGASIGLKFINN